jgi:NAD(P)-dependent dehydrogenase (short-subunit alcohol dehydrogenase family)
MSDLDYRVIIVTGGFGALGSSVVELATARGANVAVLGHGTDRGGPGLRIAGVDLADERACQEAFARVASELGALYGLVNVAGGFAMAPLSDGGPEIFDRMYRMNVRTAVAASYAALPHMRAQKKGRIVNIGATAAAKGAAAMGAYAASKSGIARFTESLAEEMRGTGITVNAVLPTLIDTPTNRAAMPNADYSKWTPPADIAEVILFLLSDKARAVTGALIGVPGAN